MYILLWPVSWKLWDTSNCYISVISCVFSLSMHFTSNMFFLIYKDHSWCDIRLVCGSTCEVSVNFCPTWTRTGTHKQLLVKMPNMKFDKKKCLLWVAHYHADSLVRLLVILHSFFVNVHRVKCWVFVADIFNFLSVITCVFCAFSYCRVCVHLQKVPLTITGIVSTDVW
jgi:hypothetical protein